MTPRKPVCRTCWVIGQIQKDCPDCHGTGEIAQKLSKLGETLGDDFLLPALKANPSGVQA